MKAELKRIKDPEIELSGIERRFYVCDSAIQVLKKNIRKGNFSSAKQEIYFFKAIKPRFISLRNFYFQLYCYTLFMPQQPGEQKMYLQNELAKVNRFFSEYHWFYIYYTSGDSCLDQKFFLRKEREGFNTEGDKLVSDLLAHQLFGWYLHHRTNENNTR